MNIYQECGRGLFFLFIAHIITLFAWIPFIGSICTWVSYILTIYAFFVMSQAATKYRQAFDYNRAYTCAIAQVVIAFVLLFFSGGIINSGLSLINSILQFFLLYYVCTTTGELLVGIDNVWSDRANTIWKGTLLCTFVIVVCQLIVFIPLIGFLAAFGMIIAGIAQVVINIIFIVFLYKSQKALRNHQG